MKRARPTDEPVSIENCIAVGVKQILWTNLIVPGKHSPWLSTALKPGTTCHEAFVYVVTLIESKNKEYPNYVYRHALDHILFVVLKPFLQLLTVSKAVFNSVNPVLEQAKKMHAFFLNRIEPPARNAWLPEFIGVQINWTKEQLEQAKRNFINKYYL